VADCCRPTVFAPCAECNAWTGGARWVPRTAPAAVERRPHRVFCTGGACTER
jgi:hypothetical protein